MTTRVPMTQKPDCELCSQDGGIVIACTELLRVIRVDDAAYPAFYRVIWNEHVAEWTDLIPAHRSLLMQTVAKVETVLRRLVKPTKVNLASLGNVVPHLHWHVIARFEWDAHFPQPIWGAVQRTVEPAPLQRLPVSLTELDAAIVAELQGLA